MAVVTLSSTAVTNADATPQTLNKQGLDGGRIRRRIGKATITSGDSAASIYRLVRIKSSDYIDKLFISSPDIGTTTTADFGLYDVAAVNAGAVVDADFFIAATTLKDGAIANLDVTHGNIITISNCEKQVWELLGLSSDPGKHYDIAATLVGAADGTGVLMARLFYIDGN